MDEAVIYVISKTSYRLEHFYTLSFLDGGVTKSQLIELYSQLVKLQNQEVEFNAALHGADISGSKEPTAGESKTPQKQSLPVFGDPSEYENLSDAEKEQRTSEMMTSHKEWVKTKKV